jgi:hypothetical protein
VKVCIAPPGAPPPGGPFFSDDDEDEDEADEEVAVGVAELQALIATSAEAAMDAARLRRIRGVMVKQSFGSSC